MRLLVLTQYFWPENFRVNDLVEALVDRGHDVTVLTGLPNYPGGAVLPEYRADPSRFGMFGAVPVERVPLVARGGASVTLALNYLSFVLSASVLGPLRLRGRVFDAVLVYQPSPVTACIPALLIGRIKRAPVLLWTLDLWPDTLQAVGVVRSRRLLRVVGHMVSAIYRRCALVLGQSRAFVANVERYSGTPDKFRYFPQWSEPLFHAPLASIEPAPEVQNLLGTFNVMFAGNVGEAQDFPAVLDAAERLRGREDIRWLIVGHGRAADWLQEEVTRRGLQRRVYLLGRHPIERMPAFFRAASALLVSLKRDPVFAMTIPGKVQTYLASGLPLLGMLDGEGARVIAESGAGFTSPAGDGAALADAVMRMADLTPQERADMGRLGMEYCAREFDRDRLLAQLEQWIADARARSGALAS